MAGMEDVMRLLKLLMVFTVAISLAASFGFAAEEEDAEPGMPPMGPPEEMKLCENVIGDWTFVGEWRMDPSQDWQPTEAEASFEYILDGAIVRMDYFTDMMGMKMHGISFIAFNRETGEWQETWMDNAFGYISFYTGEITQDMQVFSGSDMMNGQEIFSKTTTYDITKNSFKWKMENSLDGKEWYVGMRGTYTRK